MRNAGKNGVVSIFESPQNLAGFRGNYTATQPIFVKVLYF